MRRVWLLGVCLVLGACAVERSGAVDQSGTRDQATAEVPAKVVVPAAPTCQRNTEPSPATFTILVPEGNKFEFSSDCYYAPADTTLVVTLDWRARPEDGGPIGPNNLSFYKSQADAVDLTQDGFVRVGPAQHKLALFVGPELDEPGTLVYTVPGLLPGTYYIQDDFDPAFLFATLVVS